MFGVGLRADGHILAGRHRHGASHQASDTREQDLVLRRRCCGDTDDQAGGRDDAIVGPEHRCSQPADAADKVVFRMQAKTTHPTTRRSDQILADDSLNLGDNDTARALSGEQSFAFVGQVNCSDCQNATDHKRGDTVQHRQA
jgi:hypothetical protein